MFTTLIVFKILVGEPLNNNACEWYCKNVGHGRCTLVDTWWQTGIYMTVLLLHAACIITIIYESDVCRCRLHSAYHKLNLN